MFKRGAAPATAKSSVGSRTPLSCSGEGWTFRRVEAVARERLPVGHGDMHGGGGGWAPRGAAVVVRERLSVCLATVRVCCVGRTRCAGLVAREL